MLNNLSLNDYLLTHCNESMENALAAERHPIWQRSCPEMNDVNFIRLGLFRCISAVDSGRHFIQTTEALHGELLPHSTYFKSLKSSRRTRMLEAIEQQTLKEKCQFLADMPNLSPDRDEFNPPVKIYHHKNHLIFVN